MDEGPDPIKSPANRDLPLLARNVEKTSFQVLAQTGPNLHKMLYKRIKMEPGRATTLILPIFFDHVLKSLSLKTGRAPDSDDPVSFINSSIDLSFMIDPASLTLLYLCFVAKHLFGDYILQTGWMAAGKSRPERWVKPLAAHSAVHAVLTLLLVLVFAPSLWWLAPLDFLIHSAIDRTKAITTRGFTPDQQRFWIAFGIDQAAHQVTHFAFVLAILAA